MRRNNGTSKAVTSVETNTVTTCRSVYLNFTSVWGEVLRGIFGGDTALEGKAASGDMILSQTKLL